MSFFKRKPLSPQLQTAYNKAYAAEAKKIANQKQQAKIAAIQSRAKAAAARDSISGGQRALGGLVSFGKAVGKRIEKIDMEKFEASVTGMSTTKKRKR